MSKSIQRVARFGTERVTLWLIGAVLALSGGSAMGQYKADFATEADRDERAILNGVTETYYLPDGTTIPSPSGINITFSATDSSGDAFAYLDAYSRQSQLEDWRPGGLGVCSTLFGGGVESGGNQFSPPDFWKRKNECWPSSDDNITSGEAVTLEFEFPVEISGLKFRDAKHYEIPSPSTITPVGDTSNKTLLINGDRWTFEQAKGASFAGTSFTFAFDDNGGMYDPSENPNGTAIQFYLELIGDIRPVGLGDRVWFDLNGNGRQDCVDGGLSIPEFPADGIIGNAGDAGEECGKGAAGVPVALHDAASGVCNIDDSLAKSATDENGFYLFPGLTSGKYCVSFVPPGGYSCTVENAAGVDDALDSDGMVIEGGARCVTPVITLTEDFQDDRSWDLGLVEPVLTASLGDRVWLDRNGNGRQNCADGGLNDPNFPADGIIGNAGDKGADCDSGIDGVLVALGEFLDGACNPTSVSTVTANGGFYSFEGLKPGTEYCVQVDINSAVVDCKWGAPSFTLQNQGWDAKDSDVQANGVSDPVTLSEGEINTSVDAGVVCPVKIGDRVWVDERDSSGDPNGQQDDSELRNNVAGATVELFTCADEPVAVTQTNAWGRYMFGGGGDAGSLAPGDYYLVFTDPEGRSFTLSDIGNDKTDSDCDGGGRTECFTVRPDRFDRTRDCGVVEPEPICDLTLEKGCQVLTPPTPIFEGSCKGRLQQFTLIWDGNDPITVGGVSSSVGDGVVNPGDEVTFFGPFADNDVIVTINDSAFSVFHTSCSDDFFDGPEDCGVLSGDGKSDDANALNLWRLEGFVDAEDRVMDCNTAPSEAPFEANCSFETPIMPSCDTVNPELLTWRYEGGSCADSEFATLQGTDFVCQGEVDSADDIVVIDNDGGVNTVSPGGEFTISRNASKVLSLQQNGTDAQSLEMHMSCSQPIVAGATAGALKLVALDGLDGGVDVAYWYKVTNNGDPQAGIDIVDNPLGLIATGISLQSGESFETYAQTRIVGSGVFTNVAVASTDSCASLPAEVTVESVMPPCNIGLQLDTVGDDYLKIKVRNNDSRNRIVTLESMVVTFPAEREQLNEIKLDGAIYKLSDSLLPITGTTDVQVGPLVNEGSNAWTQADATKRQLDPGEERTLEIKTINKSIKEEATFVVTLNFGDSCVYVLEVDGATNSLKVVSGPGTP